MFYQASVIDKALTCPVCKTALSDPRVLPCNSTICHECTEKVAERSETDEQMIFTCRMCHERHHNPSNGFPKNLIAFELLQQSPEEVTRSSAAESLKFKLKFIGQKSEELKSRYENGADEILNLCSNLRNKVDIETEVRVEEIHRINRKLMTQIDNYEKEYLSFFRQDYQQNREHDELMKQVQIKHTELSELLTKPVIQNGELSESLRTASMYQSKLLVEEHRIKCAIFSKGMIGFEGSSVEIDQTCCGCFNFVPCHVDLDLSCMKSFCLRNSALDYISSSFRFFSFANDSYIFFSLNIKRQLDITIIDLNGNEAKQFPDYLNGGLVKNFNVVQVYFNSKFLLDVNMIESGDKRDVFWIKICNETIKRIKPKLELGKIRESYLKIPSNALQCVISVKNCIYKCATTGNVEKMYISNRSTGLISHEIDADDCEFKLISKDGWDIVVIFDQSNKMLYLYDEDQDFSIVNMVDLSSYLKKDLIYRISKDASASISFCDQDLREIVYPRA